ncbi:MAG TPA: hypothetical protein VFT75_04580 [Nocardioidaceae bacterium]|jgi:hypothetical protein|nr:hypothetical protein [Nocardioidaceae bacterium]
MTTRSDVMGALRSPLRWLAAATLVASGVVHIPVIPMHLEEAPYIGYLFIALTAVCFALAAAVLLVDSMLVWAAGGVVTALAVIAFVLSRTVGLPQIEDDIGNWTEPLGIAAITAETLTVLLAVVALRRAEAAVQAARQVR